MIQSSMPLQYYNVGLIFFISDLFNMPRRNLHIKVISVIYGDMKLSYFKGIKKKEKGNKEKNVQKGK